MSGRLKHIVDVTIRFNIDAPEEIDSKEIEKAIEDWVRQVIDIAMIARGEQPDGAREPSAITTTLLKSEKDVDT